MDPNDDGEISHHELIGRLAYGYNKLQDLKSERPATGNISASGTVRNIGERQSSLPGYLRPSRCRNVSRMKTLSPRVKRFFDRDEMFEQTRKYDGSFSPRSSRVINRPKSERLWNGKEHIGTERPWTTASSKGQNRPWTASHAARTEYLKRVQATKSENRTYDLTLTHKKMGLTTLSPRR